MELFYRRKGREGDLLRKKRKDYYLGEKNWFVFVQADCLFFQLGCEGMERAQVIDYLILCGPENSKLVD